MPSLTALRHNAQQSVRFYVCVFPVCVCLNECVCHRAHITCVCAHLCVTVLTVPMCVFSISCQSPFLSSGPQGGVLMEADSPVMAVLGCFF